jgi:ABC-type transport system involved in multi-copper enzyme maturation permease subunit
MIFALLLSVAVLFAIGSVIVPDGKSYSTESHAVAASITMPGNETSMLASFAVGLIAFIAFASIISSIAKRLPYRLMNNTHRKPGDSKYAVFEVGWYTSAST